MLAIMIKMFIVILLCILSYVFILYLPAKRKFDKVYEAMMSMKYIVVDDSEFIDSQIINSSEFRGPPVNLTAICVQIAPLNYTPDIDGIFHLVSEDMQPWDYFHMTNNIRNAKAATVRAIAAPVPRDKILYVAKDKFGKVIKILTNPGNAIHLMKYENGVPMMEVRLQK